jgi:hypothetical protein
MESLSGLIGALAEVDTQVNDVLTLPAAVLSHLLAFCHWRDFDALGQLSRDAQHLRQCTIPDVFNVQQV